MLFILQQYCKKKHIKKSLKSTLRVHKFHLSLVCPADLRLSGFYKIDVIVGSLKTRFYAVMSEWVMK